MRFLFQLFSIYALIICFQCQDQGGNLDDLINQIFSQDNSGIGNNSNYDSGSSSSSPSNTPPTPVIVQGGNGNVGISDNTGLSHTDNGETYQPYESHDTLRPQPSNPNNVSLIFTFILI